jgi:O-acetyl-ADP-ribose deacetylase (regulator of RNase III)
MTRIAIVQGDITTRAVDAIVNAANRTLLGGGGVDGAIHRAAGPELLEECRKLGGCATGQVKATKAYGIRQAKYILHAVGPIFGQDPAAEGRLLEQCYTQSLKLASTLGCRSIAFPSISTGAYGYPIAQASVIAIAAVARFVRENATALDLVEFVTFSHRDFTVYQKSYAKQQQP